MAPIPEDVERQRAIDKAVAEALRVERDRVKTETIEGKVQTLTETFKSSHDAIIKRLDDANHVREFLDKRLDETERKIESSISKQTELMAAHTASPQHTMMAAHVAEPHLKDLHLTSSEIAAVPELLHREALREANRANRNLFAKQLEIKATTAYAILGTAAIVGPGLLWVITHIHP